MLLVCCAVQSTSPAVADAPALVAQLNATGDFSTFVQTMRQRFQATL